MGSELRHPLGVTIVGGLIVSQVLTLFTTPVIYLAFDRLATRFRQKGPVAAPDAGGRPMKLSELFVRRPVATTLFTAGIALAGALAYFKLPVSPLPQVESATISVSASMAGASPETMATSVATPLERHLGAIADVTEMTSSSSVGSTNVTLQFGLNRDIDGAARDVQAAIVAARVDLPTALRSNPHLPQAEPGRPADHDPDPHLEDADPGPALRRGVDHPAAEALAGGGRRDGGRVAAARCRPSGWR